MKESLRVCVCVCLFVLVCEVFLMLTLICSLSDGVFDC